MLLLTKHKILSILFLVIACFAFGQADSKYNSQQGYHFIYKAQKKLQHGNLAKAQKFINKAKSSDYGFCGNAWASAYGQINLVEVQILIKQKNYDKALMVLDSISGCSFGANCNVRDSFKVVVLFLIFGEEKVKSSFKKITELNTPDDFLSFSDYWVFLPHLNYKFLFDGRGRTIYENGKRITFVNGQKVELAKTDHDFYDIVKDKPFYKLIQ